MSKPALRRIEFPPYALWESRSGSGTPVLLIHGLSGSSRWWSRNIEALAEKHLVAAVDLVGFGRNIRHTTPLLMPPLGEVASLLARWAATFEEPVHLIGHSMGGALAIRLAAEHPELVRSLTLVNAAGIPFALKPAAHLRALPRPPLGLDIARVLIPDFLRAGPASVAAASARVLRDDARVWMERITTPTLLVWGENDPLVPRRYGEEMQRLIPGAELHVIRAAHVAMWDNAEEFNRLVLGFLARVEAQPSRAQTATPAFGWGVAGWWEGVAWRQAGRAPDVVLVHGLGMSSAYFVHFARALFARGWRPIAPDLRGFGESADGRAAGPREHAEMLARWAEATGLRDAVWCGHSIGCNAVAYLAATRPDLCRAAVYIGPLWTQNRHPILRMCFMLLLDALRERLRLFAYVVPAYWRCGLWRWFRTFRKYGADMRRAPPDGLKLAGARDPIPDRNTVAVHVVDGAHACHFSDPESSAEALGGLLRPRPAAPSPGIIAD